MALALSPRPCLHLAPAALLSRCMSTPTRCLLLRGVTLSSDFIAGFCGETEEEHKDTISLMEAVQYDMAYMFAYSMRKVRISLQHTGRRLCLCGRGTSSKTLCTAIKVGEMGVGEPIPSHFYFSGSSSWVAFCSSCCFVSHHVT